MVTWYELLHCEWIICQMPAALCVFMSWIPLYCFRRRILFFILLSLLHLMLSPLECEAKYSSAIAIPVHTDTNVGGYHCHTRGNSKEREREREPHGCIIGSSDQTFIHITLHLHLFGEERKRERERERETTTVGQIENTNTQKGEKKKGRRQSHATAKQLIQLPDAASDGDAVIANCQVDDSISSLIFSFSLSLLCPSLCVSVCVFSLSALCPLRNWTNSLWLF